MLERYYQISRLINSENLVALGQSPVEKLLSIRAIVIGTAQTLTGEGHLTTELLGQLAFTTPSGCVP